MLSNVKEKITRHIQVRIDLFKLEVIERSSGIMSYFMFSFICLFVFFAIILFLGFGMSEVFTDMGMSRGGSFMLMTGIYAFILTAIIVMRKRITGFFSDTFVRIMTESDKEDEPEVKKETTEK